MNISQENRVLAAVERWEAFERELEAKKSVSKPEPVAEKEKDLTPIEMKMSRAAALLVMAKAKMPEMKVLDEEPQKKSKKTKE